MGQAIGDLLPAAIGVAISPVPIIAIILMLGTPKARSNGPAFAAGWVIGLVVVSVIVLLLAGDTDDADSGASTTAGVVKLLFGLLFLFLALKQWRGRPTPGQPAAMPAWMAAIDRFTAGKSFGLGALLSSVNPKNLGLTLAAATSIARAGLNRATGGTGDVLTGMIAAWLAQLLDAEAACRLAVFLHGAAGDIAEGNEGQVAMMATDLIGYLGDALNQLTGRSSDEKS